MKANKILWYAKINDTDNKKVEEIKANIEKNGWVGAPILVSETYAMLITGSHRIEAIKDLDFDPDTLGDIAENVDDIIEAWCEENATSVDDIDFGNLSEIFAGTRIEKYKNEIEEW